MDWCWAGVRFGGVMRLVPGLQFGGEACRPDRELLGVILGL